MVCDSLLYMVGDEMRTSSFWNSVPKCLREATRNKPRGKVADEPQTCYYGGSGGLECGQLQLCPRKSCPLRIHERRNH